MSTYALYTPLIVLFCLASSAMALDAFPKLCDVQDFDDFVEQTGRKYADDTERQYRKSIFNGKMTVVDLTNKNNDAGTAGFRMTINPLADRTTAEVGRLTGSKINPIGEEITQQHINYVTGKTKTEGLPDSVDWREKGGVTKPGFQGNDCGSCWSFATVGCLEGHLFRRTGFLVPLSEQDLVDCAQDYGNDGCDGGFQEYGFEYIRDNGVSLAKNYPNSQSDGQCQHNQTSKGVQIRDYGRIKPGDEDKMKEVVATLGPLACTINAAPISFEQYMGGIYDDNECNEGDVNHSIVVVGYGTDQGKDYWIIKNSYSENWGENGFMRILRNKKSFCGIADECSYPIL